LIVARFTKRRLAYLAELLLVLEIAYSVIQSAAFFFREGRVPPPYDFDINDTFMDWFNTAYYAHNPGAYDIFMAVYPPISFDFLRIFSIHSCYRFDPVFARECDWSFPWVMGAFLALNAALVYATYRRENQETAWLRTIALCLGLPMLFAVERGQLVIPCFTFFVLAHGRLLKSARLKWLSMAITINFKPYLILTIIPQLVRRRWTAFEGCILATVAVYLLSYAALGAGTPMDIIKNMLSFDELSTIVKFENMFYQPSYLGFLDGFKSSFPFMFYIGSRPLELAEFLIPLLNHIGQFGVVACFAGALWRPAAVSLNRLTALTVCAAITGSLAGGYSQIFLFFLVFMEPWRGPSRIVALVMAYLLSISTEVQLLSIGHSVEISYLSNRVVGFDVGVTLGEIVRPGLVLLIEYALVVGSLAAVIRSVWPPRVRDEPQPQGDAVAILGA